MTILTISMICLGLVAATVVLHYEVLRAASSLIPRLAIPPRTRILVVIAAAFFGHLLQIGLYALAFALIDGRAGLGRLSGEREHTALDYVYFSLTNFTTLGIGDLHAMGPMRLIAGIESLNGLVLITWSASFAYLAMEKFWQDHR
jgi:hypothetical protein